MDGNKKRAERESGQRGDGVISVQESVSSNSLSQMIVMDHRSWYGMNNEKCWWEQRSVDWCRDRLAPISFFGQI